MKHLKRIFESKEEIDVEYLSNCFFDLIDIGATIDYIEKESHRITWQEFILKIEIPMLKDLNSYPSNNYRAIGIPIENHFENANKRLLIFEEIETGLEKAKIKYPNLVYEIYTTIFEVGVSLIFTKN
jgi:hypothetical protein